MTDTTLTFTIDGVTLTTGRDRLVMHATDWTRIHRLGLTRRSGGPGTYGHDDFIVPANIEPDGTIR